MEKENVKKSNSNMQQIIIEPNENLEYYDVSRIGFHKLDDELCVVPTENIKEYIPITFNRSFIHQNIFQRLICIDECESDPKKYLLIFSTAEKCIRFIESIKNNQRIKDKLLITASSDDETFKTKYLAPIVKIADKNSLLEQLLKSVLSEILQYYKPSAKTETNILQSAKVNESSISVNQNQPQNDDENISTETSTINQSIVKSNESERSLLERPANLNYQYDENEEDYGRKTLKRRHPTNNLHQQSEPKLQKIPTLDNIIYAPNFSIINYVRNGISHSKLFIFTSSNKTLCYQYYYSSKEKKYICSRCAQKQNGRKYVSAIVEQDSNGSDYVKCFQTNHHCNARKIEPEKCQSDLIIKKQNYPLIKENYGGKMIKYMLLFTSEDKKNFYKFTYISSKNIYRCNGCSKKFRICIYAHICHDENGNEIVFVRNLKHGCSKMEYLEAEEATTTYQKSGHQIKKKSKKTKTYEDDGSRSQHPQTPQTPQNIDESKIIRKPMYREFQRKYRGRTIKKLAIFNANDATMCYELTWVKEKDLYRCNNCKNNFGKYVIATIINNGNEEEEYVQMGNFDHLCEMQKFEL